MQNISGDQKAALEKLIKNFEAADFADFAAFHNVDNFGGYDFAYNKKSNLLIYICGE